MVERLDLGERFLDDLAHRGVILFDACLGDGEELCLGVIHERLEVRDVVVALVDERVRGGDELSQRRLTAHDRGVVGHVRGGGDILRQPRQEVRSTDGVEELLGLEVIGERDDIDDIAAAAIANPGMSSWAALTERAQLQQGEGVLINGANGASGRLAIRIARHLGAGRIVVTARNTATEADLRALGADVFIALGQEPDALQAALRAEIDKGIGVVLDYVWGSSAETIMQAATSHAPGEATQRIRFVNIGSLGGLNINLPAGLLRSTGLELMGSGLSSVSNADLVRCIGEMFKVMRHIGLEIDAVGRPLAEVEQVWTNSQDRSRVVFTL